VAVRTHAVSCTRSCAATANLVATAMPCLHHAITGMASELTRRDTSCTPLCPHAPHLARRDRRVVEGTVGTEDEVHGRARPVTNVHRPAAEAAARGVRHGPVDVARGVVGEEVVDPGPMLSVPATTIMMRWERAAGRAPRAWAATSPSPPASSRACPRTAAPRSWRTPRGRAG